ncbi:hypothetical protein ACVWYH_002304 [Bradyrhizobium sp. GM24.11]
MVPTPDGRKQFGANEHDLPVCIVSPAAPEIRHRITPARDLSWPSPGDQPHSWVSLLFYWYRDLGSELFVPFSVVLLCQSRWRWDADERLAYRPHQGFRFTTQRSRPDGLGPEGLHRHFAFWRLSSPLSAPRPRRGAGTWPARSSMPGESRAGLGDPYGADLVGVTAFDVFVRTRASARQCRRRSVRCWQSETRRPVLRTG